MTIAILSWGYHETLINTLNSYRDYGLDKLDDDKVIFFQEYTSTDRQIARDYGYESFGSPENIGIAEAYKLLAAYATGEFFLFLENDWKLLEPASTAIIDGWNILRLRLADIVRYRHSLDPGAPLWTSQFEGREYDRPTHLLDAIHWERNLGKFPEISNIALNDRDWFITTAKNANWTNNPHMGRTEFIQDIIVPQVSDGDIERDMQSWWEQQEYRVAQGRGLFRHERTN